MSLIVHNNIRRIVTLSMLLALSGCANLKFAWSASYQTDNLKADLEQAREEQRQPAVSYRIGK